MAKKIFQEILIGDIFLREGIGKHIKFALYIVFLLLVYISLSYSMVKNQRIEKSNNDKLRELKAEYISKSAKLQYESKKGEIEKRLEQFGSSLSAPKNPPRRIVLE